MKRCRTGAFQAALLAGLLAGCAAISPSSQPSSSPSSPQREARAPARTVDRNLSGFPLAFRQGYVDGCDSGAGDRRRDEGRYKSELDYLMGWNDGYSVCRR